MERENGGFEAFGKVWFLHFRPLFSLFCVCCAGDRCGDVRGGLAGRLAGWERRGKTGGGEDRGAVRGSGRWCGSRWPWGLTACDLRSYNVRGIDISEERGKSGLYCFRELFLILVYSRLRLVLGIIVFPLAPIRRPLRFFVRLFRSFRFRRWNQV